MVFTEKTLLLLCLNLVTKLPLLLIDIRVDDCTVSSAWLSTVKKIALDQSTAYPDGMQLRAIYMSFSNNHSMYVQIWKPIDDNRFSLKWQRKVHGKIADGMPEVVCTTLFVCMRCYFDYFFVDNLFDKHVQLVARIANV